MDCTWITPMRTGAASALSAKYLARPESAVDFDSYWSGPALAQMDRISTDDHAQFQYYKSVGYFGQTPEPYADLRELVAGLKPGRQNENEQALAINLGLAMDDMAIAPEIYRRAKEMGLGTWLPL